MREVMREVQIITRGFDYLGRVQDIKMIENGRLVPAVSCYVFKH